MKHKITIDELGQNFKKRDIFKFPKNIEVNNLVLQNLDDTILLIENIHWKLLARNEWQIYPAIGTLIPSIFRKIHIAYELYSRGYRGDAQALLRFVVDFLDLFHLFCLKPEWAQKWYEDDEITKSGRELTPAKVRKIIGKPGEGEVFSSLFSKYVHPTSKDSEDYFFATVKEDGILKAAPLNVNQPIQSLHINLGGVHGEGNNWIIMLFLNTLLCRFIGQIDTYLYDYIPSGPIDDIFWNAIKRTKDYCIKYVGKSTKELNIGSEKIKLYISSIILGSVGDQIIIDRIENDPKKMARFEAVMK